MSVQTLYWQGYIGRNPLLRLLLFSNYGNVEFLIMLMAIVLTSRPHPQFSDRGYC